MGAKGRGIDRIAYLLMLCLVALMLSSCGGDDDDAAPAPGGCTGNCPTANAGPDREVLTESLVTLDGSQSAAGSAGALLTYQWTLTGKPAGSAATLAGPTTVRPTFTADVAGIYTARLVVNNGAFQSNPDTVTITAGTGDLPPMANAGTDGTALLGTVVTLDGTRSSDPNGTPVAYAWRFVTKPSTSQAVLVNPTSATPTFTPDVIGLYTLALTVSDGALTSPPAQIKITVVGQDTNIAPVANAGPDQQVATGQPVTLSGAASTDPNGDPLTYNWCLQSKPEGSTATLADATTVAPSFTPDVPGLYVLCLTVSDGRLTSPFDKVVIEAGTGQPGQFNGPVTSIIAAPDRSGDIYVTGTFTAYNGEPVRPIVRLRSDGSLNRSFVLADTILSLSNISDQITSIAATDDGSGDIYVGEVYRAGEYPIGSARYAGRVWRISADGSVDPSFVGEELMRTSPFDSFDYLRLNTLVPVGDGSGRIYVGGLFDHYGATAAGSIVRLNPNGTLDTTFSSTTPTARLLIPAIDGSRDIYVVDYRRSDLNDFSAQLMYRLNQDGTRDASFDAGEGVFTTFRDNTTINAVVPIDDGSGDLLVGGFFYSFGDGQPMGPNAVRNLARINPDGTLDQTSPKPQINEDNVVNILANAVDGSGDVFVVHGMLTRHKPNGALDPAFHSDQVSGFIRALLPMSDETGDIYVSGNSFVRVNRDGTLD